jgi:uncharacterized delta-60 repeat protein
MRILTALAVVSMGAPSLHAAVAGTIEVGFNPNINAQVIALATQPDGKIIISGPFTMIGNTPRKGIARLNADGSLDTTFDPGTNVGARCIAVQPDGKILNGGARLNANGSVEGTGFFSNLPGPLPEITCIALQQDGKILIGGAFATIGGIPHGNIARLNPNGTVDTSFNVSTQKSVKSIAVQPDGKILVGTYGVHRISSTGVLETTGPFAESANIIQGAVNALLVQPDGKILVGANTITEERRFSRLNADGSLDPSFDVGAGVSGLVFSIARQVDGKILIAGNISQVNGQPRGNIARLNANGSVEGTATFNAGTLGPIAVVALQPDGGIVLGGAFTQVNGEPRKGVVRLGNDAATESLTTPYPTRVKWLRGGSAVDINQATFELSTDGGVHWSLLGSAVQIPGGWQRSGLSLPAAGLIRARAPTARGLIESVVAIDYPVAGILEPGFQPNINNFVDAIATQPDGKIIIAGTFTKVGEIARNRIARLNADGTLDMTFDPGTGLNAPASYVAVQPDGKILIAGAFFSVNGQGRNSVARLNANGSVEDTATFNIGSGPNAAVFSMALQPDGKILIGGLFDAVDGQPRQHLARLNSNGSVDAAFNTPMAHYVSSIAIQPDKRILIGGLDGLIRLSSTGVPETATTFAEDAIRGVVSALLVQADGKILVGGTFNIPDNFITRLNTDGTPDAGFDPGTGATGTVYSIVRQVDGKIVIGGDFSKVDGQVRGHIARLAANGHLESTDTFNVGTTNGAVVALQGDGKILLGGFTKVNDQTMTGLVRLENDEGTQRLTTATAMFVRWLRGGSAVEINQATFELSTDGGANWSLLGSGTKIAGSWELFGLSLPANGLIRARGTTAGGNSNLSFGLVESVTPLDFKTDPPVLTEPISGMKYGHALSVVYTLPENALPGSVGLAFKNSPHPGGVTFGTAGESAGLHSFTFDAANPTASEAIVGGAKIQDGTYNVTLSYKDETGHMEATSAVVTNVTVDTTPPLLTLPGPITVEAEFNGGARVDFTVGASDGLDPSPVVSALPASGSQFGIGMTTVVVTATDWAGNTKTGFFTVTVQDTTKPVILAPVGGFTPLDITAAADGSAVLPDYRDQARTSDAGDVLFVSQSPPAGTPILFGKTLVTLTAHDHAGNTQSISFEVVVHFDGPRVQGLAATGGDVPGAGVDPRIPEGAKFKSVGVPAVADDRSVAFLGKWSEGTDGVETGIFVGNPPVLLVETGDEAPGIDGALFKTLQDPLIAPDGSVAFRGTVSGAGINTTNDEGVWLFSNGSHRLVLREGEQIAGVGSALKSIAGLSLRNGELLATGRLALVAKLVDETNDSVLLRVTAWCASNVLVREGDSLDLDDGYPASAIQTIQCLVPAPGSPGQGRWHGDGEAIAKVTLKNGRSVILGLAADGTILRSLATGDGVQNLPARVFWKRLNLPAIAPGGQSAVARGVLGTFAAPGLPPLVTAGNDVVLVHSANAATPFSVFVREGSPAPGGGGAKFSGFLDPVVNDAGQVAFSATVAGSGVSTANNTGIWWGAPASLELLARTNSLVPGPDGEPIAAKWNSFVSLVLPSGPDAGPIFIARIRGADAGLDRNLGVWGVDSSGRLRQLLRTGDVIDGKAVIGIQAFSDVPGASGGARGFNARGSIGVRVAFAGGGQAVVRIDIPEGAGG